MIFICRRNFERTEFIFKDGYPTKDLHPPPPEGIVISKGSVHITAVRGYIEYILTNSTGKAFLEWVKDTGIPDETFFSSLNHSPTLNIPGTYRGLLQINLVWLFISFKC